MEFFRRERQASDNCFGKGNSFLFAFDSLGQIVRYIDLLVSLTYMMIRGVRDSLLCQPWLGWVGGVGVGWGWGQGISYRDWQDWQTSDGQEVAICFLPPSTLPISCPWWSGGKCEQKILSGDKNTTSKTIVAPWCCKSGQISEYISSYAAKKRGLGLPQKSNASFVH